MLCNNKHCYRLIGKVSYQSQRLFTQTRQLKDLEQIYELLKEESLSSQSSYSEHMNPAGIFANNELDLHKIKVYGFDFDYTLARYKSTLHSLIYDHTKAYLVKNLRYPEQIKDFCFRPGMGARGLHLDIKRGWLMKVDSYHNIQLGTVYHGMRQVSDQEVIDAHHGTKLSVEEVGYLGMTSNMFQYVDIFTIPEITILRDVIQFFIDNSIPFAAEYVHYDVREAVGAFHKSGIMHQLVGQDAETYFEENSRLRPFLQRLRDANKQLFLITNSAYWYVNRGMTSLLGAKWQDFFDIVICQARKPSFFGALKRPFREININNNSKSWDRVSKLEKGKVYVEGNLTTLAEITHWQGHDVLYIGDHIYGDLADLFLTHGWRTGAILEEVEDEINIINSETFQKTMRWLNVLQWLIDQLQIIPGPEADILMKSWVAEREEERTKSRDYFNPYFGSIFRTYTVPTYFHRRLARFADVYTSNVCNFLNYPLDYIFFPRRMALAHENVLPTPDIDLLLMKTAQEAMRFETKL
ncbi:unnamed protein product [Adineta steineri]|uniref:5'-nucleotidase domain-containing protein 3 n=1 Tax=Adineta steineri TaxID=433720 RepID=A0A814SIA0_9BILA|nr:unnamed protein product [Adineta steineri]CAF1473654.1 unnamed protein product [Adineta steineri]